MLYIEQLHGAMVNIEVEIIEYRHQKDYVVTLVDLYKKTLDLTVSRVLGEICNSTSLPIKHQFVLTYDGEILPGEDNLLGRTIHSTNIDNLFKYSDVIASEYDELDIEHILHFNQEVHEFKHTVLTWYKSLLADVAEFEGIDKMRLGIMLLK